MVKNLPGMQETQVRSLGQEIPVEESMATHSSILAWRTPWTEEPGGLQPMGSPGVTKTFTCFQLKLLINMSFLLTGVISFFIRNGNPLQCPCLENPRDGGAWWAAVYGVARSRTRLK